MNRQTNGQKALTAIESIGCSVSSADNGATVCTMLQCRLQQWAESLIRVRLTCKPRTKQVSGRRHREQWEDPGGTDALGLLVWSQNVWERGLDKPTGFNFCCDWCLGKARLTSWIMNKKWIVMSLFYLQKKLSSFGFLQPSFLGRCLFFFFTKLFLMNGIHGN